MNHSQDDDVSIFEHHNQNKFDIFLNDFFDKCPEFIWAFFMLVSTKYWQKTDGCIVCFYWRARLHGWLDALIGFLIIGVVYVCVT
jgi:hypothetical protein